MELIERTQLRAFVVERLNQIGENLIGLETDRDLEKAAVRLTTLQLLDLAEVLETIAKAPEVFAFGGSPDTSPPAGTLYYEVGTDSLYRKCTSSELPKFFHPEFFLELDEPAQGRTVWRRVFNAEFGLTLNVIRQLTLEEATAKANTLRQASERFSESFESLEALSTNLTKVFEELEVKSATESNLSQK